MRAQLRRVDAVLVQAVIAAALSFAHLHDIAGAAGQHGWKAWAYPVSVDLLLVAAWRRMRSGANRASGWCWFLIALAASLGANIATAGLLDVAAVPAWLRILVAGWPAVAFLGGTLLAHSGATTPQESIAAMESTAPDDDNLPSVDAPPLLPGPAPVAVPAALVEHARKVAEHHRNQTGMPIDVPTLRARLGIPAPLAEAITAQL
ncbi:DUF2637 domain-containing protein [Kitasatospora sp. RB6PN24]|uniref:DUF2637 domain-containing protein n=1 Tax=Kitasatospora humi TaxID=2893891 RepID=UPI001E4FDB1F|nr:DUF2637 domain-containing protein [Kitasatospora humi]MCC9311704.1 DUF2637 domain-containing protein [Kitasatospora humi]